MAQLIIGRIYWDEYGNCEDDHIYPSTIKATKIQENKYFIEVNYNMNQHDEYIYSV